MYTQTKIFGHLVGPLEDKYAEEFYATVPKMIKEGKLEYKEDITKGLEKAPEVMYEQQKGTNWGKPVVVVAEE
jgi:NADPH-dependent curcumin reductase CurA